MQTQLRFHSHSYPHLIVSPWPPSVTKSFQNRGFPIMLCYAKKSSFVGSHTPEILQRACIQMLVLSKILPRFYWALSAAQTLSPPFCHHAGQVAISVAAQAVKMSQKPHSHSGKDGGQRIYFAVMKDWVFSPLHTSFSFKYEIYLIALWGSKG